MPHIHGASASGIVVKKKRKRSSFNVFVTDKALKLKWGILYKAESPEFSAYVTQSVTDSLASLSPRVPATSVGKVGSNHKCR